MAPIGELKELETKGLQMLLEANYDRALEDDLSRAAAADDPDEESRAW